MNNGKEKQFYFSALCPFHLHAVKDFRKNLDHFLFDASTTRIFFFLPVSLNFQSHRGGVCGCHTQGQVWKCPCSISCPYLVPSVFPLGFSFPLHCQDPEKLLLWHRKRDFLCPPFSSPRKMATLKCWGWSGTPELRWAGTAASSYELLRVALREKSSNKINSSTEKAIQICLLKF